MINYKNKIEMEFNLLNTKILIKKGDITEERCDVIVNAANSSLMGGGGVDGMIYKRAGKALQDECLKIRREKYQNGLPTGESVITTGGNLQSKFVIHTVGPVWKGGYSNEKNLLKNCFKNSLKLLLENNLKTIAFPAISTGAYGYPLGEAAKVSLDAIKNFIKTILEK